MRVSTIELVSPRSVAECLAYIQAKEHARLMAGGTDTVVQMKEGKGRPQTWINILGLKELRFIRQVENGIEIGPLTTHTDIVQSSLLRERATALVDACWEVGAAQIRNRGTIGGNLATASPAGDTIPALYVLDAVLELRSLSSSRKVGIEEFFLGPRKTVMRRDEMITGITIQPHQPNEISIFQKLGPRRAQAISIVNVAIRLRMEEGTRKCKGGKIALGSVAPTVIRAKKCEAMLALQPLSDDFIHDIGQVAQREVAPISDIRASAGYRKAMAGALTERGLYRLMRRWEA